MADVLNVNLLEQLAPFMNKDGIIEIAMRGKYKRFAAFQKVALNNIPDGDGKDLLQKAVQVLNKNAAINNKNIAMLNNLAKLQQFSMLLSGLNLCATCAGFAIMYAKLDKMSGQINQLMNVVKQGNEVQASYEFKKVISEHSNMLDCRKTQKYYTEEQMRKLVDDEFNVLNMLIDIFEKDLTPDVDSLIFSIFSLASMAAVSLEFFDEIYYFNNKEVIGNGDVWHSSHENWMHILDRLTSESVMTRIQDHGFFDLNLNTIENDLYYISYYDHVMSMKEDIRDNQELLQTLDDQQLMIAFSQYINSEVGQQIKTAFEQIEGCLVNGDVTNAMTSAMRQVAIPV